MKVIFKFVLGPLAALLLALLFIAAAGRTAAAETVYFTPRQLREMLWLRTFGTLSGRGSAPRRLAKMVVGSALLPDTVRRASRRRREAERWLERFPQIDRLES